MKQNEDIERSPNRIGCLIIPLFAVLFGIYMFLTYPSQVDVFFFLTGVIMVIWLFSWICEQKKKEYKSS